MIVLGLSLVALAIGLYGIGVRFLRDDAHTFNGLMAISNTLSSVAIGADAPALSGFLAGVAALAAWLWWHGGGGDDTKRRLRRWARGFTPVRRTAPAA